MNYGTGASVDPTSTSYKSRHGRHRCRGREDPDTLADACAPTMGLVLGVGETSYRGVGSVALHLAAGTHALTPLWAGGNALSILPAGRRFPPASGGESRAFLRRAEIATTARKLIWRSTLYRKILLEDV